MKEGIGNDNLAIAWEYPGKALEVIPAKFSMVELTCAFDPYCGAVLDTWTGIGGNSIANLMSGTNNLASAPNTSVRLQNFLEGPTNIGDNYGSRMKGWLSPPITGDYLFWIASDDNGELWLSTDSDPANKILACNQPWSAPSRDWTRYPEQKSRPISLVAGRAYYFEVRECGVFTHNRNVFASAIPVPMILMQYGTFYTHLHYLGSHERRGRQR
jgi:hypothetical protein